MTHATTSGRNDWFRVDLFGRNTKMRLTPIVIAALAAAGVSTAAAWGQGVGGASPTQTEHLLVPAAGIPENPLQWWAFVGSPENPLAVELDPVGPTWMADFGVEQGNAISSNEISLIDERLLIQGGLPWTGWQMEILTSHFDWSTQWLSPAFDVRVNNIRVSGLNVELLGPVARVSFDPLPPGTAVQIKARIAYEGTAVFTDPLQVEQFPIPEPATLLGFLMLSLIWKR
jgi:hypothetical protein